MAEAVELVNVTKSFGSVAAVDNVSLCIHRNEFFSILGPSGCGKTTTLRIIAGLEDPDSGIIKLHGRVVNEVPTHKRGIGMVFQHLALFPHMNVKENIAFGLRMKKIPKDEIKERVARILEVVGLPGFEERRIHQLSGGQQQRVALARALVTEPSVLLLDEPLGALDLKIRQSMMVEMKNIQRRVGATFVYVTHDQTEAMTMSDRIAIMKDGRVQQVGSPTEIYYKPSNSFVASFIGEAVNLIQGRLMGGVFSSSSLEKPIIVSSGQISGTGTLVIRPEMIEIEPEKELENIFEGYVVSTIFKGLYTEYRVAVGDTVFVVHHFGPDAGTKVYAAGKKVRIGWGKGSGVVLPT